MLCVVHSVRANSPEPWRINGNSAPNAAKYSSFASAEGRESPSTKCPVPAAVAVTLRRDEALIL
jgi:hypothetical protein